MVISKIIEVLRKKYAKMSPFLNERSRRIWAAAEAEALGHGGKVIVAKAIGISRTTINKAMEDDSGNIQSDRIRMAGGGRKKLTKETPELLPALEALVEPISRGDPESPLRWTCKSTRQLANTLVKQGYKIGYQTVATLLHSKGYSLQGNQKTKEGSNHKDRDAQFDNINKTVINFQERQQPVVSIDTKKKELVGDFKNGGKEWHPKGTPEQVRVHDFVDKELGKANPYDVYDMTTNVG